MTDKTTAPATATTSKPSEAAALSDEALYKIQYNATTDMPGSDRRLLLAEIERLRLRAGEKYSVNPMLSRSAL